MYQGSLRGSDNLPAMTLKNLCIPAVFVFSTVLLSVPAVAQTHPASSQSAYGGEVVEEIVARVNDKVISRSDYERAMRELDQEGRQRGASMQDLSAAHKDLLRDLIDQQLWLSRGKELGMTGETELIKRLNEIRKQYNLETLEDLEKAAHDQGVSFEDFKANIRNQIITQEVMRQELGRKIQFTPGEAQRYFEQHKNDYVQQESVRLSEILVSVGGASAPGGAQADEPEKVAAAKAKADDIYSKLKAGGDFAQLAKSFSDGPTAASGGDLGQFKRGALAKVLEDRTFVLKSGEFTEPVRTKQGFVILKVNQHVTGGVPVYKDVQEQVEESLFMSRMAPATREYLTTLREQAYIELKPGYVDSGASVKQTRPIYSAYVPPAPKKKKKVERTRYRETTKSFRQKSAVAQDETAPVAPVVPVKEDKKTKKAAAAALAAQKPGKREKIRFGQAPTKTLPSAVSGQTEDAGAVTSPAASTASEPENPLESSPRSTVKTRFSSRAKELKAQKKAAGPKVDTMAPATADTSEVTDRQVQSAPYGLNGDTASGKKKKKPTATTGEKVRLQNEKKKPADGQQQSDQPLADAPAAKQ